MKPEWARTPVPSREARIDASRPVWFVSDLHLGDGSPSDAFMGKDRALLTLLDEVEAADGRLVIVGDAVDFLQANDITPVVKAHGKLLRRLGELAGAHRVWYLHGNHDHDMRIFQDLLRFEVCGQLWVGDDVVAMHGHQFDPWIGENVERAGFATRMHHGLERQLGIWLRLPLADFYTRSNRLFLWCTYQMWRCLKVRNRVLRAVGLPRLAEHSEAFSRFWARSEAGDPMQMTLPALTYARQRGAKTIVCGHSHMPGNFVHDGVRYVNTGSWTFHWAQAVRYEAGAFTCRDRLSGAIYEDKLYRPLLDGELDHLDFDRWWRNQYLGWFRFRGGALRETYGTTK